MSKFRNFEKYEVYEDGRIWSYSRNKFLKPGTNKDGYKVVCLVDNEGNAKMYNLHRVVWEAITGKPIPEGMEINHISESKDENFFANLELVSHKQNINFGTRNSRIGKKNTNNPKLSKSVGAYKNGELVMVFPSTMEAERNGYSHGAVSSCCIGERKSHKGYEWRYL